MAIKYFLDKHIQTPAHLFLTNRKLFYVLEILDSRSI